MATCKDCFFKCYTDDADCVEATCNFFLPKDKYAEVVRCKDCKHYHARGHNGNSTIWDCKKRCVAEVPTCQLSRTISAPTEKGERENDSKRIV